MTDHIADLNRLKALTASLIKMRQRQAALSSKNFSDMTPKKAQQVSADQSWLGMEIDKAMREAHAAAVDLGIADPRSAESYGVIDYRPSAFHHYRYTPTAPRCRAT